MKTKDLNLKTKKVNRYLPGLDTLRGLAIFGVVLYHMIPHVFPGGFLGVNLFFTMSGFLINRSLEKEYKKSGYIDYFNFIKRRLKKLFLPMFWMLIIVSAFLFLFKKPLLNNYLGEMISSIFFFNNWWQIGMGNSYFMKFLTPSTITHLWYLSVQVQLYIIWLIVFIMVKKYSEKSKSNKAPTIYLSVTILSAILMGVLFTPGEDPTRVYYGTDTRIFSFAFGAFISLYYRERRVRKRNSYRVESYDAVNSNIRRKKKEKFKPFGLISLIIIISMFLKVLDNSAFTFRGGMLIFTIISGIFIFAIINPRMFVSKLFESSIILKYLGKRSYHIYLWYYPVLTIYQSINKGGNSSNLLQIIIIIIMSEISYILFDKQYISIPIYQFEGLKKEKEKFNKTWFDKKNKRVFSKVLFSLLTFSLILSLTGLISFKPDNSTAEDLQAKIKENEKKIDSKKTEKEKTEDKRENERKEEEKIEGEKQKIENIEGLTEDEARYANKLNITFIGDSMLLMAVDQINEIFPNAEIDGAVGRQLYQSGTVIEQLKSQNRLNDIVVVILGANGSFTDSQFDQFRKTIGEDKKIFLVTTNAETEWKENVNKSFKANSDKYKNIYLVDWDKYLNNNLDSEIDWLEPDQTHPSRYGARKMIVLIAKEIYKEK
ncbi:MAG: acyltransferase family protein [Andreesenia angusta]|nr:acyltransferase family protein [Andreesenia angusta]